MKLSKIKLILFGLVLLALPLSLAQAEPTSGIQISPLTYNFEINAGASTAGNIFVKNLNDTPLDYILEKENITTVDENGAPSFGPSAEGVTALPDWITFATADSAGTIDPKQEKEIGFTISIPVGADPGGHYAAIFAKEIKKTPEGQTELGVTSRVGTLILVSVPGEVTKTAQIKQFTSPKLIWHGPVDFSMKVENTGTVHYDSEAKVELKSLFGFITTVGMGKHTIIPKTFRAYSGNWTKKYPFGYYKVTASALDGNNNPVTKNTYLVAIPLIIVIPILIALILLIILIRYLRRHVRLVDPDKPNQNTPAPPAPAPVVAEQPLEPVNNPPAEEANEVEVKETKPADIKIEITKSKKNGQKNSKKPKAKKRKKADH